MTLRDLWDNFKEYADAEIFVTRYREVAEAEEAQEAMLIQTLTNNLIDDFRLIISS